MNIKVRITTKENMKILGVSQNTIIEIPLEEYVGTVVASEMGNAPTEALKAQAVASRTYAVAQGVLKGKVISDNAAKAQAYRAGRTKYNACNAAAKATEGQILKYGGRIATTYYCHSNGGRTYSSEEVWGGKRNYLVSRKDPWTIEIKNGHGVGMSQVGAIAAAKSGVTYREILSFYYPKTTLETIEKEDDYSIKVLKEIETRVKLAMKEIEGAL